MKLLDPMRRLMSQSAVWPPIDLELADAKAKGYLRGAVLNAGAGWRDVAHLVDGTVTNQDIAWPDETRRNVDIFSPIHEIPVGEGTFDAILCVAVLEHVENPTEVVAEFRRVLKCGGYVIASVPFLQPEHKIPTDYQRYTKDGLCQLFMHGGFEVVSCRSLFTIYHSLHWIVYEWLQLKNTMTYRALRAFMLPILVGLARNSELQSDKLASAFQIVARKPRGSL